MDGEAGAVTWVDMGYLDDDFYEVQCYGIYQGIRLAWWGEINWTPKRGVGQHIEVAAARWIGKRNQQKVWSVMILTKIQPYFGGFIGLITQPDHVLQAHLQVLSLAAAKPKP